MDDVQGPALVTGASRGFGRAIAAALLAKYRPGVVVLNAGPTFRQGLVHTLSWPTSARRGRRTPGTCSSG